MSAMSELHADLTRAWPILADQLSGDILCPLCGEPLDIRITRTESGAEPEGHCAMCMTIVEIAL